MKNTLTTIDNILIISIIVTIFAIIYLFSEILCYLKIYRNLIDEERIYYQMEKLENRIRKDFNNTGICNVCFNNETDIIIITCAGESLFYISVTVSIFELFSIKKKNNVVTRYNEIGRIIISINKYTHIPVMNIYGRDSLIENDIFNVSEDFCCITNSLFNNPIYSILIFNKMKKKPRREMCNILNKVTDKINIDIKNGVGN